MADTKIVAIRPDFNMNDLVNRLTQLYRQKGFEVTPMQIGNGISIQLSKDNSGIKKFVGLALGVTVNITVNESANALYLTFTDAEWTGKIVGLAVGWFLCLIPFCIAIYGCVKQSEFPNEITNDIRMLTA